MNPRARGQVYVAVALLFLLQAGSARSLRQASATASSCSRVAGSSPLWENAEPDCGGFGSGCYECAYHNTGDEGYTICAENPNGSGALCDSVADLPDDWPDPDPGDTDPDPGQPPPDSPPPDAPPPDAPPPPDNPPGDGGGAGGGGCAPPDCHEADGIPNPGPLATANRLAPWLYPWPPGYLSPWSPLIGLPKVGSPRSPSGQTSVRP